MPYSPHPKKGKGSRQKGRGKKGEWEEKGVKCSGEMVGTDKEGLGFE